MGCKFCGFTSRQNTLDCISAGADTLGFNFWPHSKRYLPPGLADWLLDLPPHAVRIGVFVNAPAQTIASLHGRGLIHFAQLHGDESPAFCSQIASWGIPVIKAVAVQDAVSLPQIREFPDASAILLDAFLPGSYGGGGRTLDWDLARRAVDENPKIPIILSGGLGPDNAAEAVAAVHPAAIDLASGVESAPGIKDPGAIRRVLAALRDAKPT